LGPSCAQKVTLVDHWPENVLQEANSITVVGGPSRGSCVSAQAPDTNIGDFSCNLLTIRPNECVEVTVDYTVPANLQTCSVDNVATVSSMTFDPELCNNVDSDTNALVEKAILSVSKTSSDSEIDIGDFSPKEFTVEVLNNGPSMARDVVLTDIWPAELCQYAERITTTQGKVVSTGGDIIVSMGDLAPQQTVTIKIPFSVCAKTVVGEYTNHVNAFSPTDETCRDAEATVNVVGIDRRRKVEAVPAARMPVHVARSEPKIIPVAAKAEKKHVSHVDVSLVPLKVQVKVSKKLKDKNIHIEVKNTVGVPMRITEVKVTGKTVTGRMVNHVDVTQVGEFVKSTTCGAFAARKLPVFWAEVCKFELSEDLKDMSISVAGSAKKPDGVHAVLGAGRV